MRIIDDELWNEVQARLASKALPSRGRATSDSGAKGFWDGRRVLLLTGKIFCGVCGGQVSASGGLYLGCVAARHHTCSNRRTHLRAKLEAAVLQTFASSFMKADALEGFIHAVNAEFKRRIKEATAGQDSVRRELAQVERQLGNLMDRILDGLSGATVQRTLSDLEVRRERLLAQLSQASATPPALDVDLARTYREYVARLQKTKATRTSSRSSARSRICSPPRGQRSRLAQPAIFATNP